MAAQLTVVLCTCSTRGSDAADLMKGDSKSFSFVPGPSACRLVVVCDGYQLSDRRRTKPAGSSRKTSHPTTSTSMPSVPLQPRPGMQPAAAAAASTHGPMPRFSRCPVIMVFGWAVKAAIESGLVQTEHILVVQHDRSFMRSFDMRAALRCMVASNGQVRYLLLPTRSTTTHRETIFGRAGVWLPYLHICGHRLLQLAFWWDSTHIASVSHYKDFVLRQKCVKRGTFPEDTLGRQMLDAVKANGLAGAEPYHAYLWDDEEDRDADGECRVVGHLNGAHWRAWADEGATRLEDVGNRKARRRRRRRRRTATRSCSASTLVLTAACSRPKKKGRLL